MPSQQKHLVLTASRLSKPTDLAAVIRQRIARRLGDRVRNLAVDVDRGVIHLAGQCSTYYTKQLALHATLGVVEDEQVENEIEVCSKRPVVTPR